MGEVESTASVVSRKRKGRQEGSCEEEVAELEQRESTLRSFPTYALDLEAVVTHSLTHLLRKALSSSFESLYKTTHEVRDKKRYPMRREPDGSLNIFLAYTSWCITLAYNAAPNCCEIETRCNWLYVCRNT
jgi:hypothetical protein